MYTLLLLLIYLAFISLGLPDLLLESAWPIMQEGFQVPLSYAGIVSMIISGGTILSSLMSERLTKKLTTQAVTVLGCAPIYPSLIHSTPANFGEKNSQAIIGIQMASAYVGATFMPPVFGLIANHISIRLFPVYVLFFLTLMFTMLEKTFRLVK